MNYQDDIKSACSLALPWNQLNGKNILVTGATGLIGSAIIDVLMQCPAMSCQVYALGRNRRRAEKIFRNYFLRSYFHFIEADISCPLSASIPFHYIIHAASNASPNAFADYPVEIMQANFIGTNHLLSYGHRYHLERFLLVSSGEIYGEGCGRIFSEDDSGYVNPMIPRSCYPSSKRASETLCAAYSQEYGIGVVVARPCHIYGPHFTNSDNRVYAQFIRNVILGENILMHSSGMQYRSWCYIIDCVSAIFHILFYGENMQAYNIADEKSNITIRRLAELIAEIGGKRVVLDCDQSSQQVIRQAVFNTEKLKRLGWRTLSGDMRSKLERTITEARKFQLIKES